MSCSREIHHLPSGFWGSPYGTGVLPVILTSGGGHQAGLGFLPPMTNFARGVSLFGAPMVTVYCLKGQPSYITHILNIDLSTRIDQVTLGRRTFRPARRRAFSV